MIDILGKLDHLPTYIIMFVVVAHFIISLLKMIFDFIGKSKSDPQSYLLDKLGEHYLMLNEISVDSKEIKGRIDEIEKDFKKHIQTDNDFQNIVLKLVSKNA